MSDSAAAAGPWIDDSGVMRAVLPARPRGPQDVEMFAHRARSLVGGKRSRLLLDAREVTAVRPEAWLRAITNVETFASAVAIVVSATTPDQIAAYQTQIDAFLMPCRLFVEVDAAERWIVSIDPESAT